MCSSNGREIHAIEECIQNDLNSCLSSWSHIWMNQPYGEINANVTRFPHIYWCNTMISMVTKMVLPAQRWSLKDSCWILIARSLSHLLWRRKEGWCHRILFQFKKLELRWWGEIFGTLKTFFLIWSYCSTITMLSRRSKSSVSYFASNVSSPSFFFFVVHFHLLPVIVWSIYNMAENNICCRNCKGVCYSLSFPLLQRIVLLVALVEDNQLNNYRLSNFLLFSALFYLSSIQLYTLVVCARKYYIAMYVTSNQPKILQWACDNLVGNCDIVIVLLLHGAIKSVREVSKKTSSWPKFWNVLTTLTWICLRKSVSILTFPFRDLFDCYQLKCTMKAI